MGLQNDNDKYIERRNWRCGDQRKAGTVLGEANPNSTTERATNNASTPIRIFIIFVDVTNRYLRNQQKRNQSWFVIELFNEAICEFQRWVWWTCGIEIGARRLNGSIKFSNPTKGQIHIIRSSNLDDLGRRRVLRRRFRIKIKKSIAGFGSIEITGQAFWVRVGFRRFPIWPIF